MTETEAPDPAESVAVAWVANNDVKYSFFWSFFCLVGYDFANHGRTMNFGSPIAMRCGTDGLVEARNKCVSAFLEQKHADWMLWLDTDMGFAADTLDRLLDAADVEERPMVGALCFSQRETEADEMGGWRCHATPTIFDWTEYKEQQGFAVRWDYPANTVTRVHGTGSACILIHRSVFERVEEKFGPVWYNRAPNPTTGQLISEDLSFCIRVNALDIPIFVHTGVRTTHQKTIWLQDEDYWQQRAVNPPPVTVEQLKADKAPADG